jgi:hypothetical protein
MAASAKLVILMAASAKLVILMAAKRPEDLLLLTPNSQAVVTEYTELDGDSLKRRKNDFLVAAASRGDCSCGAIQENREHSKPSPKKIEPHGGSTPFRRCVELSVGFRVFFRAIPWLPAFAVFRT